ncbi:hypothetical protein [Diaphorobacter sp.]|uniref:hypothetical protein n=1 Tax=Diaphorobacter sp. TaxID=1934310 RepID=UPI0028A59817|nr:hypothetical protein [Diaphorobacter sp.]
MRSCIRSFTRSLSCVAVACVVAACTSAPTTRGEVKGADANLNEWLQSDMNRVANFGMRENLNALYRMADKLYKRNPAEWRKGGAASREEALNKLKQAIEGEQPWEPLQGKRDIDAMALAMSPSFTGDRVSAFIYSTMDMIVTAHGGKTEFYLIDGQDAQMLYNAARNIEIAVWMLAHRRGDNGKPLLLADEINPNERNLSYEREFGKIIARLDLLAAVTTEKYRRAVIGYAQGFVGGSFLQFLPVR